MFFGLCLQNWGTVTSAVNSKRTNINALHTKVTTTALHNTDFVVFVVFVLLCVSSLFSSLLFSFFTSSLPLFSSLPLLSSLPLYSSLLLLSLQAFTAWANHALRTSGSSVSLSDCVRDLQTGAPLIALCESLSGQRCPLPYRSAAAVASSRTLCIDNCAVALQFVQLLLPGLQVAAADLADCNAQVVLALMWRLILKYSKTEIASTSTPAGILLLLVSHLLLFSLTLFFLCRRGWRGGHQCRQEDARRKAKAH